MGIFFPRKFATSALYEAICIVFLIAVFNPLVFTHAVNAASFNSNAAYLHRRATIIEKVVCSSYYGSPHITDCDDAADLLRDALGTTTLDYYKWEKPYLFLDIGAETNQAAFRLPMFFNSGQEIQDIFSNKVVMT